MVKYIRDLQYLISANTLTLKAKWHENDFGIFIKGVKATITIEVYMNKVLHQKRILVLHYLILKQKILVKGGLSCEYFWIKILKYTSKLQSNFSGKE